MGSTLVAAALLATALPAAAQSSVDPCKQPPCVPQPVVPSAEVDPGVSTTVESVGLTVEVIDFQDGHDQIVRKEPGRGASGTVTVSWDTVKVDVDVSFPDGDGEE